MATACPHRPGSCYVSVYGEIKPEMCESLVASGGGTFEQGEADTEIWSVLSVAYICFRRCDLAYVPDETDIQTVAYDDLRIV